MRVFRISPSLLSLLLLVASILFTSSAVAAPQTLHFQGTLSDASGAPITGEESVSFRFYDSSEGGNQLPVGAPWEEELSVYVSGGVFSALLGKGVPIPAAVFEGDTVFLEFQVGTDLPMTERIEISSAPYSFKARIAETVPTNYSSQVKFTNPSNSFSGDWFSGNSAGFGALTVDQSVGIGTTDPEGALDIVSSGDTKVLIHANDSVNDRNPELELKAGNTDAGGHSVLKFGKTAGSAGESLQIQNDAGTSVMSVNGNGNVGIGTTSPGTALDVKVPVGVNDIAHFRSDNSDADLVIGAAATKVSQIYTKTGQALSIGTDQGVERVRITSSGNVGVGTSTPSNRLTVSGGDLAIENEESATIRSSGHSLTFGGLGYAHRYYNFLPAPGPGSDTWVSLGIFSANTAGQFTEKIHFASAGSSFLNGGNVGIGLTNPGYPLTVNGAIGASYDGMYFGGSSGDNAYHIGATIENSLVYDAHSYHRWRVAGNEVMNLDWAGNLHTASYIWAPGICIGTGSDACRTSWPTGGTGGVGGSGTINYLSRWTSSNSLGDSTIYDNGSGKVGIGNPSPSGKLDVLASGTALVASSTSSNAINATSSYANDKAVAVYGEASSTGSYNNTGVMGVSRGLGNSYGQPLGVRGDAIGDAPPQGQFGVLGYNYARSQTNGLLSAGVWGGSVGKPGSESEFDGRGSGMVGETYSRYNLSAAGQFYALSTTGQAEGVAAKTYSSNPNSFAIYASGKAGGSGGWNQLVNTKTQGPTELYAMSSAQPWFEDFGEGQLKGGRATIQIDPLFLETVEVNSKHRVHIFVQPYGDAEVYVRRGEKSFDVIARAGTDMETTFSYRIVAKPRNAPDVRLRRTQVTIDRFMEPGLNLQQLRRLNEERGLPTDDLDPNDVLPGRAQRAASGEPTR